MRIGVLGRLNNLLVSCALSAEHNVFFDARAKQDGLLADHADLLPYPFQVVGLDVVAVYQDSSTVRVIEALNELDAR